MPISTLLSSPPPPARPKRPSECLPSAPKSKGSIWGLGETIAPDVTPWHVLKLLYRNPNTHCCIQNKACLAITSKRPPMWGHNHSKKHSTVRPWEVPSFYFLTNTNELHRFLNSGPAKFLCSEQSRRYLCCTHLFSNKDSGMPSRCMRVLSLYGVFEPPKGKIPGLTLVLLILVCKNLPLPCPLPLGFLLLTWLLTKHLIRLRKQSAPGTWGARALHPGPVLCKVCASLGRCAPLRHRLVLFPCQEGAR